MQGTPPRLVLAEQNKAVEERLQRAITAAPHASRPIAAAIQEAYVLYFRATAKPLVENLADLQAKPRAALDADTPPPSPTCARASHASPTQLCPSFVRSNCAPLSPDCPPQPEPVADNTSTTTAGGQRPKCWRAND